MLEKIIKVAKKISNNNKKVINKCRYVYAKLKHPLSLRKRARIFRTDKQGKHNYGKYYERHFSHVRNKKMSILEIGIGSSSNKKKGGASLRLWKSYFNNSEIHGIDIYDKSFLQEDRINTHVCDQGEESELEELVGKIGEIDIVIDDGSHINEDVITSFKFLFRRLSPGGYYVVEDTQTSYWKEYGGGINKNSDETTMQFFGNLVDCPNYKYFKGEDYTPTYFDRFVEEINFYENIVFVKKRKNLNVDGPTHFHG
jgi:hypothetical protein